MLNRTIGMTENKTTAKAESYWPEFDGKQNDSETLATKARALSPLLVKVSEWNVPFVREAVPGGRYNDSVAFNESLVILLHAIDRIATRTLEPARKAYFFGAVLASVTQKVFGEQTDEAIRALRDRYRRRVARYGDLDVVSDAKRRALLTDTVGFQFGKCLEVDALDKAAVVKRLNEHVADFVTATTECFQLHRLRAASMTLRQPDCTFSEATPRC